jgi:glycosyltransferase involved in cell wall biosynthesis
MKIVHLLGWYFPDSVGGTEIYVEGLCRRLRAAGHEVLVAAPLPNPATPSGYTHDGVTVFRYPIPAEPTRDEAYARVPVRGAAVLHDWLARQRPDVLHVHSFTTGVALPEIRAARRAGLRVIATCHLPGLGYMCRTGELMQWGRTPCDGVVDPGKCAACNLTRIGMPKILARVAASLPTAASRTAGLLTGRIGTTLGMRASVVEYRQHQRELFELVDRFVVLNETARRMLIADGSPAAKILVNRLGLGCSQVLPKPGPDERPTRKPVRFGYVGRLHAAKGLVALVDALRRIPQSVSFAADVCGPVHSAEARAFRSELRNRAGGDPRIRLGDAVPPAAVPDALAAFDLLLCPSISFENGPTIALEANAVGTPVMASRVGNLAEIISDGVNGRLVAPGDVDAWADALAEAARDPARTVDVWRRHLVPPRTMDDVARDYLAMYEAA